MLDTLPQEIFEQVLSRLNNTEVKALRLVNVTLSQLLSKTLFRKLDISCLTLHRLVAVGHHHLLRDAVEEMFYHEMQLRPQSPAWVDRRQDQDAGDLWSTIRAFCRQPPEISPVARTNYSETDINPPPNPLSQWVDWRIPMYPGQDLASIPIQLREVAEFKGLMSSVHSIYSGYEMRQSLDSLERAFCKYLPLLPNLRRFRSIDAAAGEIAHNYPLAAHFSLLDPIQEYFPLTDAGIRTSFSAYSKAWPGHGFFAMLAALNNCTSLNIQSLEIVRGPDLWDPRGVDIKEFQMLSPLVNHHSELRMFQGLHTLKLSLEASEHDVLWKDVLPCALAKAHKLQHLEISLTSSETVRMPFKSILPMSSLPSLQAAVLNGFSFESSEMSEWLFQQPMLETLKFYSPRLNGLWKELLDKLSQNPEFMLNDFELQSPWDHEIREQEEGRRADTLVPSRVSNVDALDFINKGGINPFATRRWRKFEAWSDADKKTRFRKLEIGHSGDTTQQLPNFDIWSSEVRYMDDNDSEYSDVSEYLTDDHPDPLSDEDPDGPEYDEDHDFDAEDDSDADMDDT